MSNNAVDRRVEASIRILCPPGELYDMISDVTRMGEWSPSCTACFWVEGSGPQVGAWFIGQNLLPPNWEQMLDQMDPEAKDMLDIAMTPAGPRGQSRSQVVVADRGREFTFATFPFKAGQPQVHWSYTFASSDSRSTELTESWTLLPDGFATIAKQAGSNDADSVLAARAQWALDGIHQTLAALKQTAESGHGL
jgi:Polyketide cyclase / dehydrase and lipid transport